MKAGIITPAKILINHETSEASYHSRDMEKSTQDFANQLEKFSPEEQKGIMRESFIHSNNIVNASNLLAGSGFTLIMGAMAATSLPGLSIAAGVGVGLVSCMMGASMAKDGYDNSDIIQKHHDKTFPETTILNPGESMLSINMKSIKDKIGQMRDKAFGMTHTDTHKPK